MWLEPVCLPLLRDVRLPQQSWPTTPAPHSPGHRATPGVHPPCPLLPGPLQVAWQASSLCARLCTSVHCKGDSDTLQGIWRQEETGCLTPVGLAFGGVHCGSSPRRGPSILLLWVTDDELQLPGLLPKCWPDSAKDRPHAAGHTLFLAAPQKPEAGASGSECRPWRWNLPSGASCTDED